MLGLELGLSSSTSASAASGQGDMNVSGSGSAKLAWIPWLVLGVVVLGAMIIWRKK